MTGRVIAFAWGLLLLAGPLFAQVTQSARYEFEQKNSDPDFTVVSMNERGIALIHELDKFASGKKPWEVILLDTALTQTWATKLTLSYDLSLIGYECNNENVFYLFRKGPNDTDGFHVVQIDSKEHLTTEYDLESKLDFKLTHFSVVGTSAILGGYITRQPSVLLYDLKNASSKVLPGFFIKNSELIDIRVNRNNTFNTLLIERTTNSSEKKLIARTFDETGALILDDVIEIDNDKSILSGITSTLDREELLVAGTWGAYNGKTAMGYFTFVVDPFNKQPIRYYSFSELGKFLDYYTPKKANRIRAKSARRKKAGKLPGYGLYVNSVRLTESKEGFLLLSEIYSPTTPPNSGWNYYNPASPYGYGSYSPYGYNPYYNRYTPYSYGNNNSFQRSDVVVRFSSVTAFDGEGKFLDDTGQKIDDVKIPGIDQVSDFLASRDEFVQVYREKKNLKITITDRGDKSVQEQQTQPVMLKKSSDVIRSEDGEEGSMRYWFGDHLFLWGYESVKDNESGNRHVFYINKVSMAH